MNKNLNRLLARQLSKLDLDVQCPPDIATWSSLLSVIDQTYNDADQDRYGLERSHAISLYELNLRLCQKSSYEARLRILFGAIHDLIWLKSPEGVYLACNPMFERFFGAKEAEIIGKTDYDFVNQERAETFREQDRITLAKGGQSVYEEWFTFADDGHRTLLEVVKTPMIDASGKLIGVLGIASDITLRKQAEEMLRSSNQRFETVLQTVPDLMFELDRNGRYLNVWGNQGDLLAASENQLLGRTVEEILPSSAAREILAAVSDADIKQQSFGRQIKFPLPQGDSWFELSVAKQSSDITQEASFIVLSRDITERKRVEAEIIAKSRQLQTTLDAIPDLLFEVGQDGRFYNYHAHRTDLLVLPPEEFLGKTILEVLPADAAKSCMSAIQEALEQGRSTGKEYFLHLPQGGHWFELSVALMSASNDQDRHLICLSRDITERKQAEADLRIASVAFESQDSLMITDADSVILRVNRAFTETTGYTAEEAVGQTPRLLKSGRHDAAFYAEMWESIIRTGTWHGEVWDRRKSGEEYPILLTISAVKGSDGAVTHYVGSHIDITHRKAAEEVIESMAFYDTLTKLPNRRLLDDRLVKAMATSKRSGRFGALMFLDLDNFKPLNDKYGHSVGDLLLVEVAHRITRCVREVDTVARYGGDEFVVILSELDEGKAEYTAQIGIVAEKIRAALAEPYLLTLNPEGAAERTIKHHCSASIGVVVINGESSAENFLRWADMAMYQAKRAGRNIIRFHDLDD